MHTLNVHIYGQVHTYISMLVIYIVPISCIILNLWFHNDLAFPPRSPLQVTPLCCYCFMLQLVAIIGSLFLQKYELHIHMNLSSSWHANISSKNKEDKSVSHYILI
jgi:hypothetical protein